MTRRRPRALAVVLACAWLLRAGLAGAGPSCGADCDGQPGFTDSELRAGITLVFEPATMGLCALEVFDSDGDGRVTAAELLGTVRAATTGCPTATPSASASATLPSATATPSASPELPTASPSPSTAMLHFTDVTVAAGFSYSHGYVTLDGVDDVEVQAAYQAGGVAAGDFDGDGWIDLYVVRGDIGPNLLFRNRGDGAFDEVGAAAGVAFTDTRGSGPTFADFDGDGRLDLFIGGVLNTPPRLLRNLGGTFEDVTTASHITADYDTLGATFGDYDKDGDLDLLLAHWGTRLAMHTVEHLWRNNGDRTFTAVGHDLGLSGFGKNGFDLTFTWNLADIDSDGWPDLLLASDFGTSQVFHNDGGTGFSNTTTAVISDENGMGGAVGDYDNDGDLDWFVTSIFDPNGVAEGTWGVTGNRLYRNRGDGTFDDVTDAADVRNGFWGWGTCWADFNNDGWLDLFHVNGLQLEGATEFFEDPSRLFMSKGDGTFSERAAELGITDPQQGRGVVCFDYDGDGDLDLFITNNGQPPRLYRNDSADQHHHLAVRLRGRAPNTEAIGARIAVTATGLTQLRELRAGSNYLSQDPALAHFGLGEAQSVDLLRVQWPGGQTTMLGPVAVDQTIVVEEPE